MFVGIHISTVPVTGFASMVCARAMPYGPVKHARFKFARTIVPIVTGRASVTAKVITVTVCTVTKVRLSEIFVRTYQGDEKIFISPNRSALYYSIYKVIKNNADLFY